jgi:hypothetical protein
MDGKRQRGDTYVGGEKEGKRLREHAPEEKKKKEVKGRGKGRREGNRGEET